LPVSGETALAAIFCIGVVALFRNSKVMEPVQAFLSTNRRTACRSWQRYRAQALGLFACPRCAKLPIARHAAGPSTL